MNRSEKALNLYSDGLNCAQSVITTFADLLEVDEDTAIRIASGFGGGMGRLQETCGAVTGAFMVIGYLRSKYDEESANENINKLIQEFSARFTKEHQSINCKALISFDLNSDIEREEAKRADVFAKKCSSYVKTAVEILDDIVVK